MTRRKRSFTMNPDATAHFVSRDDTSGTNALGLRLWKSAGIVPNSSAGGGDIAGGIGAALNAAAAMPVYTLSDRGTWMSFKNKEPLRVMVEDDPALLSRYDVIELNSEHHAVAS